MASDSLNQSEWKAIGSLSAVFYLRMLGLFLVLPVLSPYASKLSNSSPLLIGLAIGAFPITQTLLQIPFGWWSDRVGRKPVIIVGLLLFIAGSIMAALAQTIYSLIIAFFLQGSGAIGSVIIALLADLTRDKVRTRTMAIIGAAIGLAVGTGFVFGPLLATWWNVEIIFYLISILAIIAIPIVLLVVPTPSSITHKDEVQMTSTHINQVFANLRLWKFNAGIFFCNTSLRALFVVLPFLLHDVISPNSDWIIYLTVFTISGLVMFPSIFWAEKYGFIKEILLTSIILNLLGLAILGIFDSSIIGLFLALTFYFIGFSLLEALLPSLVTQEASKNTRGTAMGTFNMSQYFGGGVGGVYGGLYLIKNGTETEPFYTLFLFLSLIILGLIWTIWISNIELSTSEKGPKQANQSTFSR